MALDAEFDFRTISYSSGFTDNHTRVIEFFGSGSGQFTAGHQATIFEDRATGAFGYRYHGVNYRGEYYETKNVTGFESKQAALKDALENYNIGTGC